MTDKKTTFESPIHLISQKALSDGGLTKCRMSTTLQLIQIRTEQKLRYDNSIKKVKEWLSTQVEKNLPISESNSKKFECIFSAQCRIFIIKETIFFRNNGEMVLKIDKNTKEVLLLIKHVDSTGESRNVFSWILTSSVQLALVWLYVRLTSTTDENGEPHPLKILLMVTTEKEAEEIFNVIKKHMA